MASTEHEGRIIYVGGFNTYEGTTIPILEVYDFYYNRCVCFGVLYIYRENIDL